MRTRTVVAVLPLLVVSQSCAQEGPRARSLSLNGTWEWSVGEGDERAETPDGQSALTWQNAELPGPFMPWSDENVNNTAFVWARRSFNLDADQARALAVLRWNHIELGAVAFINGRKVGQNDPTGPYQVIVPPGVLQPGPNQIVLKVAGTRGARKSASGYCLFPAGFANRAGLPAVTDDVWIDFADRAYMKWVLAIPDLASGKVTIRVTPTGLERLEGLTVRARVRPWPDGVEAGAGHAAARLVPDADPLGGEHFGVDVPIADARPWTYEDCNLYVADVSLLEGETVLDRVAIRFGMREIGVANRNYTLNGRTLWLRGSNLVFEWDWGDTITGHEFDYLVTEAREMSMNSFRTHTRPLPRLWADICDEHGTMILAEFPVLYNYADYQFTREELEVWHRNCMLDAAGWMSRLWNHPAVIMWVLSNESTRDNEWEEGPFQDLVNALDPTRPTLRTGTSGTRENYDVHTCGNITDTAEGNLQPGIGGWFATAGERTTTNTEYMNYFGHPKTQWTGIDDGRADELAVAQIGSEHTEAMRRARLDGIWPYMYAGWTRTRRAARVRETGEGSAVWKANFAAPASAARHSSLSPVLASLDLFNPSYSTGQEVTTDLYLINDSWHAANIHVDLLLTTECPELIPEAECLDRPAARWSHDFDLPADSLRTTPIAWQLPDEEGSYWLTARTTGLTGRPVLSQRFVRAVAPPQIPERAKRRTFVVLGGSDSATEWFAAHGLSVTTSVEELDPAAHEVVVWEPSHLTADERRRAAALCEFAARGGRVVVLATPKWDWRGLCDVRVPEASPMSRVFAATGAEAHPMLAGVRPDWLQRWNGLPGTVAIGSIEGPGLDAGRALLWAVEPKRVVVAEVAAAQGGGTVLFCQLAIRGHVLPDATYDPVADRILANLLAW